MNRETSNEKARLGERLKDELPIDRLRAECEDCGVEFFDSRKNAEKSPLIVGGIIETKARAHRVEAGHDNLDVSLDRPTPVKEIDATITVNG
jgi:hypothetical protein